MEHYARTFRTEDKHGYSVDSGVMAVVDDNLRMELDQYGNFRATRIDASKVTSDFDHQLSAVSAMSDESPDETEVSRQLFADIPGIQYDPVLGYYLDLYAGYVNEGTFRERASSGGFTSWILVKLLERGLIDGAIHITESEDDDLLFKYAISRTPEEIQAGSKSRYYPGEVSGVLNQIKQSGGTYAITGIPSFIYEIRLLARIDPEIAHSIRYTLGLICGHQKSTKYAEALAWQHGIKPGDLQSIDFRKKDPNGLASRYLTEMRGTINGKPVEITKDQQDLFVGSWGHGFFKRRFSDFSEDAFNETADITLGDAWLPQYVADGMGTNVIIVRNPVIAQIISEGIREKTIHVDVLDAKTVVQSQKGLTNHAQGDPLGYRLQVSNGWKPTMRQSSFGELSFVRKRIQDVRLRISTQSHSVYREAVLRDDWGYFERKMRPYVWIYKMLYRVEAVQTMGISAAARKAFDRIRKYLHR